MILEYLQRRWVGVRDVITSKQRSSSMMFYPPQLGKRFIDEDKGDEDGEDFLGEAGDEAHQEAALKSHNDHHNDDQPHSHPHSPHNVLDALRLAELNGGEQEFSSLASADVIEKDSESAHSIERLLKH